MPVSANDGRSWASGDSSSRAALLLVESLIHGLVAKSVLTLPEAIEIIDIAAEVESDAANALDGHAPPHMQRTLLGPLSKSFRVDLGDESPGGAQPGTEQ